MAGWLGGWVSGWLGGWAAYVRSILLPQNEQFLVTDSMWVNMGKA